MCFTFFVPKSTFSDENIQKSYNQPHMYTGQFLKGAKAEILSLGANISKAWINSRL
jgi:hypothetical protein